MMTTLRRKGTTTNNDGIAKQQKGLLYHTKSYSYVTSLPSNKKKDLKAVLHMCYNTTSFLHQLTRFWEKKKKKRKKSSSILAVFLPFFLANWTTYRVYLLYYPPSLSGPPTFCFTKNWKGNHCLYIKYNIITFNYLPSKNHYLRYSRTSPSVLATVFFPL